METLENQPCPVCRNKTLTLIEDQTEVPYFGKLLIFSMKCRSCEYEISDVEAEEKKDPIKYTIEIESEKDMTIRVVKSSTSTVSIPQLRMKMESGANSIGFVSNIEGLLQRFESVIKNQRDSAEEPKIKKHAKNLLKKLWKVKNGDEKLKIIIDDPSGNCAIISEKAKVEKSKSMKYVKT